jgi:hypothetical protein
VTHDWSAAQLRICDQYECDFVETTNDSKLGIALSTLGKLPINGLRHPPNANMSGWFIWWGTELSEDPDFFAPLHVAHLEDRIPEVMEFLGLSPGYRFLLAGDQVDVWFDPKLLSV